MKKFTLILVLLSNIICAIAQTSGTTGSLTWNYDEESNVLSISGKGEMPNYGTNTAPWEGFKEAIGKIVIGDGVTTIGSNAFTNCLAMTEVDIPEGVTTIGNNAFSYCMSIESISIPASVKEINESAFEACGYLTEIYLSEGLESIGEFAFTDCYSLGELHIPNTVTDIGRWAFSGCEALYEITIPGSVKSIGDNAFSSCYSLCSVQLEEGVENIEDAAFNGCEQLESILIPASVSYIGGGVFSDCKAITSIDVAEGNKDYVSVDGVLYSKNMDLLVQYPAGKSDESFDIPESVLYIGDYAFGGNDYLTSVGIHDKVKEIGNYSFARCSGVASFSIPAATVKIGDSPFHDCYSLTEINVDENNPYYMAIDNVLYDKNLTILIQYPEAKTSETYIAPSTLITLSDYAFFGNQSLKSIDLPEGLTKIGDFAFGWAANLSTLTVRVDDPAKITLGVMPFFRGANAVECTLRVPTGSKAKYASANMWQDFAPNIEEFAATGIAQTTTDTNSVDVKKPVYDLSGTMMKGNINQQRRGLYIIGGKKVIKR